MIKDQSVRDPVREILEIAQESNSQLPSIRAIRAKIGKGSLGTISEAVNEWKQENGRCQVFFPLIYNFYIHVF